MVRDPIPTWYFSLVVVRLGRRFLLVQERKHGQTWYLPAGRVEPGESLAAAAVRETLEESGVRITLDGIVRVEHSPQSDGSARCRVIFVGHPADDSPPKSEPDRETLGARWVTLDELDQLNLRGGEVRRLFERVASGAAVYPLDVLANEGAAL